MPAKKIAHESDRPWLWFISILTVLAALVTFLYSTQVTKADRHQVDELQRTMMDLLVQGAENKERIQALGNRVDELSHRVETIVVAQGARPSSHTNPSRLRDPSPNNDR